MILKLRIENVKDKTGEVKKCMFITLIQDKLTSINAVAEIPFLSSLDIETEKIIRELKELNKQKNGKIRRTNSRKCD